MFIKSILTLSTGFRLSPLISPVDEEVESQHLKFLATPPGKYVISSLLCL